jgi:hypothetical protein
MRSPSHSILALVVVVVVAVASCSVAAFSASLPQTRNNVQTTTTTTGWTTVTSRRPMSSVAAEVPTSDSATSDEASIAQEEVDLAVPTVLPSDCGMDYIPLANMLATGQLVEADQVHCPFRCVDPFGFR